MSPKKGSLALVLFGLPFLCVGVGMGVYTARTLLRAEAVRAWQEVPATVVSCDLKSESDSDGGTTYRVVASYRYEVEGRSYTGDRVSFHSGADNIGSFQQRLYAALSECQRQKKNTPCWVNPANPAEAVLSRTLRPELIAFGQLFVFAFGGAGIGLMMAGAYAWIKRRREQSADGLIRMSGASAHRVWVAVAVAWNAYAGWLIWELWHLLAPEPVPWPFWLIAAIGVVLALAAGYRLGRFRKFGVSRFALSPAPAEVGGTVAGTIRIPARVSAQQGFELKLQCFQRITTPSGDGSSTCTECRWEEVRPAVAGLEYGDETLVTVRFTLPPDQSETTALGGGDGIFWRLTATAATRGIGYRAAFEVPVRASSAPGRSPTAGAKLGELTREKVDEVIRRQALKLERRPDGGVALCCSAARNKGLIVFLVPFTAAWGGICYVLWAVADAPLIFPIVFSLFGLALVAGLIDQLLVSRGIAVERSLRECVVWRRLAGVLVSECRVPVGAVADFRAERAAESGNIVYYRVVMARLEGKPLTVATGVRLWNDAACLADLLKVAVLEA